VHVNDSQVGSCFGLGQLEDVTKHCVNFNCGKERSVEFKKGDQ